MQKQNDVLVSRYADAYLVSRTIDTIGVVMKYAGVIGAAVIASGAAFAVLAVIGRPGALNFERFLTASIVGGAGMVVASTAGIIIFVLGTLMSAQGQILGATLDTAVNSSRLLTDGERARIMAPPDEEAAPPAAVVMRQDDAGGASQARMTIASA